MTFDTLTIPVSASGDPKQAIRDCYDDNTDNHSTFGHLNTPTGCRSWIASARSPP